MITASKAVENGAEWLDVHAPGWYKRVNLDTLYMKDCYRCILGQVFGGISNMYIGPSGMDIAEHRYQLNISDMIEMGFESETIENYDELYDEWVKVISSRARDN